MPTIEPLLWCDDDAEEAALFYVSLFADSAILEITRYGEGGPGPNGTVMMVDFRLGERTYRALNAGPNGLGSASSPLPRGAIALFVSCETQAEVDRLWDALADGGELSRCGWLRDRFGCSWNIVPAGLEDVLGDPDPARRERAMKAMLAMVKLDLDALRRAADAPDDP